VLEVVRRFSYNDIFKSTTKRLYRNYVDRERDECQVAMEFKKPYAIDQRYSQKISKMNPVRRFSFTYNDIFHFTSIRDYKKTTKYLKNTPCERNGHLGYPW
jgi:hypothetical protein